MRNELATDSQAFATLVRWSREPLPVQQRWLRLEAAHVVAQRQLGAHALSHWHMLALAVRTHDWNEAAGQLLRLALVPLGHLTGRLPLGNPGRATVSAFAPMPVPPELRALIASARAVRVDR